MTVQALRQLDALPVAACAGASRAAALRPAPRGLFPRPSYRLSHGQARVGRSSSSVTVAGTFPGSFLEMSTQAPHKALPNLSTVKGFLFDVDGTLTNSDPLHFRAFHDILLQYNYQGCNNGEAITREFFDEYISGGHNILLSKFLWPDWPQDKRDAFSDEKEALFRKYADSVLEPVPGLMDFLAWIKERGLKKVAVTNAPKENARVMLEALGLGSYFDKVILGEDCARPKPHPDPYQAGLDFMSLKPDECIVCEDSPAGTTAGVAAGIPVVGILTSQTPERMRRAGCSIGIPDYTTLVALASKQCSEADGNGAKSGAQPVEAGMGAKA